MSPRHPFPTGDLTSSAARAPRVYRRSAFLPGEPAALVDPTGDVLRPYGAGPLDFDRRALDDAKRQIALITAAASWECQQALDMARRAGLYPPEKR